MPRPRAYPLSTKTEKLAFYRRNKLLSMREYVRKAKAEGIYSQSTAACDILGVRNRFLAIIPEKISYLDNYRDWWDIRAACQGRSFDDTVRPKPEFFPDYVI